MASSLTCGRLAAWTITAVLLQILGLAFFVIGFFPVKPTLPGLSGPESYQMPTCGHVSDAEEGELPPDQLRTLYREMSGISPSYDRLILMVVDGLPAEFVLGRSDKPPAKAMMDAMPYTQSLLVNGLATGYHAKAAPPTVTMPRLKAMISGAIGGFLDVAFNFNTQALLDDNILDQFYRIGWKMVMLGDETWIKMFPKLFTRIDGVSSFYVKDTVEVDFNVSRHLEVELAAKDWNLLILHYLGLDHVGHIGGRHSILMAPKMREMDEVIKRIHVHNILHQGSTDFSTLLVVVSDHGMTDGGNHGGSSYQETDSLALFIGHRAKKPIHTSDVYNAALQVDIAPTLALLFGVPIPRNNVGVILTKLFDSLTEEQRLRALQLNSWQFLRLLHAHLPGLLCGELHCVSDDLHLQINVSNGDTKEKFCHLLSKAVDAHNTWLLHQGSGCKYDNTDDFQIAFEAYYKFLRNASEWLSHKATDKPVNLLLSGIAIMLMSCALLLCPFICLFKEVHDTQKESFSEQEKCSFYWQVDEGFIPIGIIIHVLSLGASSMVEEEQYTWHFLTSTLYLIFLFSTIRSLLECQAPNSQKKITEDDLYQSSVTDATSNARVIRDKLSQFNSMQDKNQIFCLLLVLICGRILRGWHQGGVNWVHLPDVSKLLVQAGPFTTKVLQIISLLIVMLLNSLSLRMIKSGAILVFVVHLSHFLSALLVLLHVMKNQSHNMELINLSTNLIAQIFYISIGSTVVLTVLVSPWILPVHNREPNMITQPRLHLSCGNVQIDSLLFSIQDSLYMIGVTCTASWCLLQLLLQQPTNAFPILLILLQNLASIFYFSTNVSRHKQWVEVATMHFLGMAGHFGLGNSNNLATIDVAGAFIGISSHSTVLSGILMFIITYASPLLSSLSMVMDISMKDMRYLSFPEKSKWSSVLQRMIAFPCLLPLVLNSAVLTAFTIILLFMRNHLFVWSVFSPKYLYVCAATVSVYIGVAIIAATGAYTCIVFFFRAKMLKSIEISKSTCQSNSCS